MAKKIRTLVPAAIREAVQEIHECADAARAQVQMKAEMLEGCLMGMQQMLAEAGGGDVEFEMTDGSAMFLMSSLEEYLDGEPFVAFAGEDGDSEYMVLCRIYIDPDDEDEEDEQTISADTQILRQQGDLVYVLAEDGWELADVEIEEEE